MKNRIIPEFRDFIDKLLPRRIAFVLSRGAAKAE
jgi:hypothetical protein